MVAEKVQVALDNGLTPLFCIGELLEETAPKSLSISELTSPVKAPEALTFGFCAPIFSCECIVKVST
jgi:hypothetical protein